MNEEISTEKTEKLAWEAPVLLELNVGLDAVENQFSGGSDGGGGLMTSMPS
jgi:hypothetical protein